MDLVNTCLIVFNLCWVVGFILKILNRFHITKRYEDLPSIVRENIRDQCELRRINAYNIDRMNFGLIRSVYNIVLSNVVMWWAIRPEIFKEYVTEDFWYGIAAYFILDTVSTIIDLPWNLFSQFVIEEKHGFNKMTYKLFFQDLIKGKIITFTIMIPVGYIIIWFLNNYHDTWWLLTFLFSQGFGLFMATVYPYLIEPWFNKVQPLSEGRFKDRVMALIRKSGVGISKVEVIDGSQRSAHSNAYTSGFLWFKRLVLFDTILKINENGEIENEDEILSTVAHELGHLHYNHSLKNYIVSTIMSFTHTYLMYRFINSEYLYDYTGFEGLIAFAYGSWIYEILYEPVSMIMDPIFSWYSRSCEYEADRYSIDITRNVRNLNSGLIKLYQENKTNVTPHPWIVNLYYSHPLIQDRIKAANDYYYSKPENIKKIE